MSVKKVLALALLCAVVMVHAQEYMEELELMAREPERMFDLERDVEYEEEGVYYDSRVYPSPRTWRRSVNETTLPVFGNIGTLGTYYTIINVANDTFRVVVDTGSSVLYVPSTQCTLVRTSTTETVQIMTKFGRKPPHDLSCASLVSPLVNPNRFTWISDISHGSDQGLPCSAPDPKLDLTTADVQPIPCGSTGCSGCSAHNVCTVSTTFGDGASVTGLGQTGPAHIGALFAPNISFAATINASQGFVNDPGTQIDGLWGMAFQVYPHHSLVVIPTVLDRLFEENPQVAHVFSLRLDQVGGSLLIGGINDSNVVGPLQFTPLVEEGWYVVNNPRLYIGSSPSNLTQKQFNPGSLITIVDSGATLINLPETYWNALQEGMKNASGCPKFMCGPGPTIFNDSRFCFTDFPFDQYPTIAFYLPRVSNPNFTIGDENITEADNTTRLILTPEQYMINTTSSANSSCVTFGFSHGGEMLIFGDTLLTQYYTVFDRQNLQVGFSSKVIEPFEPAAPFVPFGTIAAGTQSASISDALLLASLSSMCWILLSVFGVI